MTPSNAILAAIDAGQIIKLLVIFGILVAWVVRNIMSANKPAGQRQAQQPAPRRRPPPQQQPNPPAQPAAGQQADPLRDQVEEFLRRAGRQRQPNQPPAAARPPQPARAAAANEIELLLDNEDDAAAARRRPLADPFSPMIQPPAAAPPTATAQLIVAQPPRSAHERLGKGVAEHVAEHVSSGSQTLAAQTSRLGQRIIHEDEQFDVQLKAKFGHSVGTLAASRVENGGQPSAAPAGDSPAAQIAAMLANPEGVRQAIVLNEILRPPGALR
jgi:hypothetical protein